MKKLVKVLVSDFDEESVTGTVEEVLNFFQDISDQHGKDAVIEVNYMSACMATFKVLKQRYETDAEYAERICREDTIRGSAEARQRAEYERLKKLYG